MEANLHRLELAGCRHWSESAEWPLHGRTAAIEVQTAGIGSEAASRRIASNGRERPIAAGRAVECRRSRARMNGRHPPCAAGYSINLSARSRTICGILIPSALAVFRLIVKS